MLKQTAFNIIFYDYLIIQIFAYLFYIFFDFSYSLLFGIDTGTQEWRFPRVYFFLWLARQLKLSKFFVNIP